MESLGPPVFMLEFLGVRVTSDEWRQARSLLPYDQRSGSGEQSGGLHQVWVQATAGGSGPREGALEVGGLLWDLQSSRAAKRRTPAPAGGVDQ